MDTLAPTSGNQAREKDAHTRGHEPTLPSRHPIYAETISAEAAALPPQEHSAWFLRLGHRRALLLVTALGTAGSVLITLLVAHVLGLHGAGYLYSALIGTIVPLIMIPLTTSRIIRLSIQLYETRARLHYLATHDALTAAYSRAYFLFRFEQERQRAQISHAPLSLLMVDVDAFKSINDCYGHIGGDIVLEAIARAIQAPLRPSDLFARYGGEEFILLLPATRLSEACAIAEKIRESVAATTISLRKETVSVTVSIGISSAEQGTSHMIDRADAALYEAKRDGRNRWAC